MGRIKKGGHKRKAKSAQVGAIRKEIWLNSVSNGSIGAD